MDNQKRIPNRLIKEKSPYLLQHAYNPVDWYPWGDEAFDKARAKDKPILLSIGYSTCHWCHVMERECFEDQEVAELLNKHFVAIKVDREERPDIDCVYMEACQAITGNGGWPLTVIMTPDKKPFFVGTYFPKHGRMGIPGLMDILPRISDMWQKDRAQLISAGRQIVDAIKGSATQPQAGTISEDALHQAYQYYDKAFDGKYGGFGSAPKFPVPHNLMFLLRYWKMSGQPQALAMVEKTLESMYRGGIYDHIGFGFARYSTDRLWLAPHFEKMLYDNALLSMAYCEAYKAAGKKLYAKAADEIFTFVLRDMTSPDGAFYSAIDADSEGAEGKFYLWTPREIEDVLGRDEGRRFCEAYGISEAGNFEGKSIPNLIKTDIAEGFDSMRNKLYLAREKRAHPFKDDKILTAWNGLMIAALAFGSRALGNSSYAKAACHAMDFIWNNLRRRDGRLLARYRDGQGAYAAYAGDYACIIWALIELYQAVFEPDYLIKALQLSDDMIKYYWDQKDGGFFQSASDAEELIARLKETYDGAVPSANSMAAMNFLRLAALTGSDELEHTARRLLDAFGGTIARWPAGHAHFLSAICLTFRSPSEVIIAGDIASDDTAAMIAAANKGFNPWLLLSVKLPGEKGRQLESIMPSSAGKDPINGKAAAYVCRDFSCLPPITAPEALYDNLL